MFRYRYCAVLLTALFPIASLPDPATDEQMASEAIGPYVPSDSLDRQKMLDEQFKKLTDLAARAPKEIRPVTVFFKTGLSYKELHDLREASSFEVIDVVMKAPQGSRGGVMSINAGMADLWAIDGTLEERLIFMITSEQRCFAKMAKHLPEDQAHGIADLATNPFFVYSARIVGSNKALAELQKHATVRAVLLNLPHSIIADFESAKRNARIIPHRYSISGFHC